MGDIEFTDKLLNGFKVAYTGSGEISNHGPVCERRNVIMANVIIQDERRQAETSSMFARKYGIDTNNPAMREAAEVTAVRSREAMEMGRTQRRYY